MRTSCQRQPKVFLLRCHQLGVHDPLGVDREFREGVLGVRAERRLPAGGRRRALATLALTAELHGPADTLDTEALERDVTTRAADARALLGRHVTQARQMLRSLLEGRLACEPFDDGTGRGYTFAAIGTPTGGSFES